MELLGIDIGGTGIKGAIVDTSKGALVRDRYRLVAPELFIVGGGASKKHEKFLPLLTVDCDVVPARLRNEAGIIGAAMAAAEFVEA